MGCSRNSNFVLVFSPPSAACHTLPSLLRRALSPPSICSPSTPMIPRSFYASFAKSPGPQSRTPYLVFRSFSPRTPARHPSIGWLEQSPSNRVDLAVAVSVVHPIILIFAIGHVTRSPSQPPLSLVMQRPQNDPNRSVLSIGQFFFS